MAAKSLKPGDRVAEGVVVRHDDAGVWLGREAGEDERDIPARHSEHFVGGKRVFLSHDQAPIQAKHLHKAGR